MVEVELAPIMLIKSGEDVLGDRAVRSIRTRLRERDPNTDLVDIDAAAYAPGDLTVLLSPSLFGEPKAVFVPNLEKLSAPFQNDLLDYLKAPDPESILVLRHNGGARGKKVLDALRKAKVPTVTIAKVKYASEKNKLVMNDVRAAGRRITADAVDALVAAMGSDLRELLAAVSQLLADVDGTINEDHVDTYFAGRVEATAFNVADAVVAGTAGRAVELSRHAIATGNSPVAIVGALAAKFRAMAQVLGQRSARTKVHLKINDWQIKRAKADLRGWNNETLARAIGLIAQADADVKGQSRDPEFAVERAIVNIAKLRTRR
ncbi:DNA polymerase III subunit delta [Trueperella bialowiezensis]|uniref:DNA-directed DNA polymerase n=1 Tax=Trueperella bialowiezensis TaxID=312285 RepID=A0A448PGM9_9ACTO|nr:DNA polymerase III subunit delta [Trueperella bialowiezensis]VEI14095.1 DNA polymerase III, delta subunit [Trueperella bialowiezensis]